MYLLSTLCGDFKPTFFLNLLLSLPLIMSTDWESMHKKCKCTITGLHCWAAGNCAAWFRLFSYAVSLLQNSLPLDIPSTDSPPTFKSCLKTHLFKLAYVLFLLSLDCIHLDECVRQRLFSLFTHISAKRGPPWMDRCPKVSRPMSKLSHFKVHPQLW